MVSFISEETPESASPERCFEHHQDDFSLYPIIQICSGITSSRVLDGELLYTKILEVNLFAFDLHTDCEKSSRNNQKANANKWTSRIFVHYTLYLYLHSCLKPYLKERRRMSIIRKYARSALCYHEYEYERMHWMMLCHMSPRC